MTDEHRLAELEKDVAALQEDVKVIPVLLERVDGLRGEVKESREEGKSVRAWLIGFCLSLALAAIGTAITLTQILPGGGS